MACPRCGCRVTYRYDMNPDFNDPEEDYWERCASCGAVFDIDWAGDDDFDPDEKFVEQICREAGE